MSWIPAALRRAATVRADYRCEYCGLSQSGQLSAFHIDHVIPVSRGGATALANLALACVACSLHKAAQVRALDPETKKVARIFNPRTSIWSNHFDWRNLSVIGLTATGRATITALRMNAPAALRVRTQEQLLGRHPPPMP